MNDFIIRAAQVPAPCELLNYLDNGAGVIECFNPTGELHEASWDQNQSVVFYEWGRSTRGVECWHTNRELVVRVPKLSSPEDYSIAFAILEFASQSAQDKTVRTNFKPSKFSVDELPSKIDERWILEDHCAAIATLFDQVLLDERGDYLPDNDRGVVSLYAPVRDFFLGNMIVTRLLLSYQPDTPARMLELVHFVFELIRYVQYPERLEMKTATLLTLENGGTAAFVDGEHHTFVPHADCIYLNDHARGCWAALPAEHVKEQFMAHFREPEQMVFYDEFQFAVQPIPELTYRAFVKAVAPLCQSVNIMPSSVLRDAGVIHAID